MEAHMQSCPQCDTALAGYRKLGKILDVADEREIIARASERVWKNVSSLEPVMGGNGVRQYAGKASYGSLRLARKVLTARVSLPIPAAAAAAVLVFFAFFAFAGPREASHELPQQALAPPMSIGFDDYAVVPIHDMSEVIRHFSLQDSMDFMVIRLPENRSFSRTGQPALINAVDYSAARRNFHR